MDIVETIILAVVEGLTEFLPISSTGHMILAAAVMKIHENEFVKSFEIAIQLGAILAIASMYAKRFLQGIEIHLKLITAFIPTALVGFLAYDFIKSVLFNPIVVSVSLVIGGIILILIDGLMISRESRTPSLEKISYKNAFYIGLVQCLSMVPGTSRAAATIVGGVFNGLDKRQATEFSFLLAVPTMFAAAGYDLFKTSIEFSGQEIMLLTIGLIGAFVSAWIAVKMFLRIVDKYGFKHFGYYRIVIGLIFLYFMT